MYIGTHYNSYYNTLFPNVGSAYGAGSQKNANGLAQSQIYGATNNFYNQNLFQSSGVKYVQDIKAGANGVKSAIKSLSGASFQKTLPVSSKPENMEVKSASSYFSAAAADTTVQIKQVARGQVNEGEALDSKEKVAAGSHEFSVTAGGKTHNFKLEVKEGEDSADLQFKMADMINAAGIGVKAEVQMDEKKGTSVLSLESTSSGANDASRFTIQDVSGSAVALTGAANVKSDAQDAIYSVNGGGDRVSESNDVYLGNGINATLKKASDDPIRITRSVNHDDARAKVDNLVKSYNQLYGAALENTDDAKASRLFSKIVNVSKTYSNSLAQVGIGFDENGYMKVNEEQYEKAKNDGSLERFFTENSRRNYGFTNQLKSLAEDVSLNTSRYASSSSINTSLKNSFEEYLSNLQVNSITQLMTPYPMGQNNSYNSGWLFDFSL